MPSQRSGGETEARSRRDQILDETQRIVGERGYHGFGIQELAERCGLTKPGLLHHFGTKEHMLLELLRRRDAEDQAELSHLYLPAYDATNDPLEQREMLRQGMIGVMQKALERPELIRLDVVLRAEAVNPEHPAHDYFVAREREKRKRIASRATWCADANAMARQILALMTGLEEQWLREGKRFNLLTEWEKGLARIIP